MNVSTVFVDAEITDVRRDVESVRRLVAGADRHAKDARRIVRSQLERAETFGDVDDVWCWKPTATRPSFADGVGTTGYVSFLRQSDTVPVTFLSAKNELVLVPGDAVVDTLQLAVTVHRLIEVASARLCFRQRFERISERSWRTARIQKRQVVRHRHRAVSYTAVKNDTYISKDNRNLNT